MSKLFLLDTSVFVEASQRYYASDICPGFWSAISNGCHRGVVTSIDEVQSEIQGDGARRTDWLSGWIEQQPDLFKASKVKRVINAYQKLETWFPSQAYASLPRLNFCTLTLARV